MRIQSINQSSLNFEDSFRSVQISSNFCSHFRTLDSPLYLEEVLKKSKIVFFEDTLSDLSEIRFKLLYFVPEPIIVKNKAKLYKFFPCLRHPGPARASSRYYYTTTPTTNNTNNSFFWLRIYTEIFNFTHLVYFIDEALWSGILKLNLYGELLGNLWGEYRTLVEFFRHMLVIRWSPDSIFSVVFQSKRMNHFFLLCMRSICVP